MPYLHYMIPQTSNVNRSSPSRLGARNSGDSTVSLRNLSKDDAYGGTVREVQVAIGSAYCYLTNGGELTSHLRSPVGIYILAEHLCTPYRYRLLPPERRSRRFRAPYQASRGLASKSVTTEAPPKGLNASPYA